MGNEQTSIDEQREIMEKFPDSKEKEIITKHYQ